MGTESLRRRSRRAVILAVVGLVAIGTRGWAAEPSAIIEDFVGSNDKLQPMDYLFEGDTLVLKGGDSITVSYLVSCAIEVISGEEASVTIGRDKSSVTGKGRVKRKFVECGGTDISLTRRQSDAAAGIVVRGGRDAEDDNQPRVTIYSLHPVIKLSLPADTVTITRIDKPENFTLAAKSRRVDSAKANVKLAPGGVYRAAAGGKSVVFKVANTARAHSRNLISSFIEL